MCNSSTAANHSRCLVMSHNALRDGNNNKKKAARETIVNVKLLSKPIVLRRK